MSKVSTRIQVYGGGSAEFDTILTPEALEFLEQLAEWSVPRIHTLLAARAETQQRFDDGEVPTFLAKTQTIRESDWTVASLPDALTDRRVEITGPVERKMIINALNSGANVFMADFEDSSSPTWENMIHGQINLRDAVAGTITYQHPTKDKVYSLNPTTALLMVRPRGLHLVESHMMVGDVPMPASLVDFGLFFFHNAHRLMEQGLGPYFYLPKLESHEEARLWNDIFVFSQDLLGIPQGSIKATVLIETLPAAFEMDEILYELREHSAGLNCGRWDYIFSYIKTFRNHPDRILPDRGQVGMTQPFLRAYSQLAVKTCHRRGVHGMGGMAAQIPIKNAPDANERAMSRVREDKLREVQDGHDGTWVAHPALVSLARQIFDSHMPEPNQTSRQRDDVQVSELDLIAVPEGTRTEDGLRTNINVGIRYLESWLRGQGCVPLYNLMEDAATAEISRTQIWQWVRHGAQLEDGRVVDTALVSEIMNDEMRKISGEIEQTIGTSHRFDEASSLFLNLCTSEQLEDFLTVPAYELISQPQPTIEKESRYGTI
ncbi:MAG: malate synthase A [Myxococcales bacterium]|nr:malate synthase A [Myxococcales bacterium]